MFFNKKKKENSEKPVFEHPLLGRFQKNCEWHTERSFDLIIFGRSFSVFLYVSLSDSEIADGMSAQRERAVEYFLQNTEHIQSDIESVLMDFFHVDSTEQLASCIKLDNMSISSGGKIGAFFSSEFDDDFIEAHVTDDGFTGSFGVVVYPEKHILSDEMECYKFDNE